MYIVEFERTQDQNRKDCTAVRLLNMALPAESRIIAETAYMGQPPNLYLEQCANYAVIRLQCTGPVVGVYKKAW